MSRFNLEIGEIPITLYNATTPHGINKLHTTNIITQDATVSLSKINMTNGIASTVCLILPPPTTDKHRPHVISLAHMWQTSPICDKPSPSVTNLAHLWQAPPTCDKPHLLTNTPMLVKNKLHSQGQTVSIEQKRFFLKLGYLSLSHVLSRRHIRII